MLMLWFRVKTLSAQDHHCVAQQYKKCTCQCTEGLSATQNDQGAAEGFSTLRESNPSCPTHYNWHETLRYGFMSVCRKNGIWLDLFCNRQPLFWVQDCHSQIAQVEYQGQAQNTRILERKPLIDTSYACNIDLCWNIFTLHNFCSLLIEQLINLEKVRTGILKFRTDLWDRVMDGWSVTQQMIVYKDNLLKKSSNWKLKLVLSTLVTTCLSNITFHLLPVSLPTLDAIVSESCQTSFPSLCAPPSEVAVLIYSNLSRRPFLGQVAFHLRQIGLQTWVSNVS